MNGIGKECIFLISELKRFSADLLDLGPLVEDDRFEKFEQQIDFELPLDFKTMMKTHNGMSLNGTEIYALDPILRGKSLDAAYNFEHNEARNPMPKHLLPFSPDGAGNHYCLNLSVIRNGRSPVVFWQHDFDYRTEDDVEVCNDSFLDWIKEVLIDWTLEEYNYDGTER